MTERIAGISLFTVLILLTVLTAARGALCASRVALFRSVAELLESVILAIVFVFLLLRPFALQSYYIPSGSMHPTLWEGDHILVNKCVYRFQKPQRGDILVFRAPRAASPDEKEFIKRLIGLPGDVIQVDGAYITVGLNTYTPDSIRTFLGEPTSATQTGDPSPLRLTRDAIWLGSRHITALDFARAVGKPRGRVYIHPGCILINGKMRIECDTSEDPAYDMPARLVPQGAFFVLGDNRNNSDDSHVWGMLAQDRVIGRADYVFWPTAHARRLE